MKQQVYTYLAKQKTILRSKNNLVFKQIYKKVSEKKREKCADLIYEKKITKNIKN